MSTLCTAWDHGKYLNGWESSVSGKQDEAQRETGVTGFTNFKGRKKKDLFCSTLFILTREMAFLNFRKPLETQKFGSY